MPAAKREASTSKEKWSEPAQNAAGQPRAFLWRNGEMTDLNTLIPAGTGWILESAAGISDGGQIVGYGTLSGKRRAFLLTPPTDLATFIGGTYQPARQQRAARWHRSRQTGPMDDVSVGVERQRRSHESFVTG